MRHPLMRTDSKTVKVSKNYSASRVLGDGSEVIPLELGAAAQRPAETGLLPCLQVAFLTPLDPATS